MAGWSYIKRRLGRVADNKGLQPLAYGPRLRPLTGPSAPAPDPEGRAIIFLLILIVLTLGMVQLGIACGLLPLGWMP